MPFKSEKQRRYMHANLPELAKRWERDYANGGIASQGGMKNYLGEQPMVNAPKYWQSRPDKPSTELAYITEAEKDLIMKSDLHGSLNPNVKGNYAPNEGPSGIMSLDYQGDKGTYGQAGQSYGDRERPGQSSTPSGIPSHHPGVGPTKTSTKTGSPKDHFTQSWTGPKGWFGGGGYQTLNVPGDTSQGHKSRFGLGSLLRGAMSIFGGVPGSMMSMLSRINPQKLRGWNEEEGRYNTQDEWESARRNKQLQGRLDKLYSRKSLGKGFSQKNIDMLEAMGLKPSTAQNVDSGRGSKLRGKELTNKLSANNYNFGSTPFHPSQGGIMSTPQGTSFNNPVGGVDQYAREMEALEAARSGQRVRVNELGGTLQDFYTNRNPRTNANTQFDVWDDNINFTNNSIRNNMKMMEVANNPALSRYKTQEFAPTKFNDPWGGDILQQATVNEDQMKTIDEMAGMYNQMEDSGYKLNTEQQQGIFDAAKQQDTKESSGLFGFDILGGEKADPMTQQEYRNYLSSQGYI